MTVDKDENDIPLKDGEIAAMAQQLIPNNKVVESKNSDIWDDDGGFMDNDEPHLHNVGKTLSTSNCNSDNLSDTDDIKTAARCFASDDNDTSFIKFHCKGGYKPKHVTLHPMGAMILNLWMLKVCPSVALLPGVLLDFLDHKYWSGGFLNTMGSWLVGWYLLKLNLMFSFGLLIFPSSYFFGWFCVDLKLSGDRFLWNFGDLCQGDGVFKWTPTFDFEIDSPIIPTWVLFPNIRPHLFSPRILHGLGSMFGLPLKINHATSTGSRVSVAHILVELEDGFSEVKKLMNNDLSSELGIASDDSPSTGIDTHEEGEGSDIKNKVTGEKSGHFAEIINGNGKKGDMNVVHNYEFGERNLVVISSVGNEDVITKDLSGNGLYNVWLKKPHRRITDSECDFGCSFLKDGLTVKLCEEKVLENTRKLQNALVVKVFGENIPQYIANAELRRKWSNIRKFILTWLGKGWSLCAFDDEASVEIF
ncbi:hypothetical protein MA16_Dca008272 [Dendrobium catenatum]|uniref:Uncharacterized protein n=1 Tax=Dendrobium catenatum TaxID=906689 RepID=A0A2I0X6P3_9ASPA|nr:hypothetical protein MA16_Dca008272 [Dendrobium catenatum]